MTPGLTQIPHSLHILHSQTVLIAPGTPPPCRDIAWTTSPHAPDTFTPSKVQKTTIALHQDEAAVKWP